MTFEAPDDKWLPYMKMFFGFILLLVVSVLAGAIALGKVEEQTSFGLHDILEGLKLLLAQFAVWAFMEGRKDASKQVRGIPMILIILLVLILMNGVGYWANPTVPGVRYGFGGLGLVLLILFVLIVLHIIPGI